MSTSDRYVLLNPGPVTLTDSVRSSLLGRDMCHREGEFADLMAEVRERLRRVYDSCSADWTAVLVTGSGTAAVESMVSSLVEGPGAALVATNGVYGERMAAMLERAGKPGKVVRSDWDRPIDFATVEHVLSAEPQIKQVVAVHHETTTGRLNDLDRLAEICRRYGKRMLVDAVSSFGGERIEFEEWPIDAIAATANKCLHGVTGVAFVITRQELLSNRYTFSPSLYLDLATNFAAQETGFPAYTPAIQSIYALRQALCELDSSGGWSNRREQYRQRSARVTTALQELGIRPYLQSPADRCPVLTAYQLPPSLDYQSLSTPLQQRRIVIYAGQKQLEKIIFRIAVMGDLTGQDFELLIATISELVSAQTNR